MSSGVAYPPPTITIFSGINYNTDFFYSEDNEGILTSYVKKTGSIMTGQLRITTNTDDAQIRVKNVKTNAAAGIICENDLGPITVYAQGCSAGPNYIANNGYIKAVNSLTIATGANTPAVNTIPTMIVHSNQYVGIGVLTPLNQLSIGTASTNSNVNVAMSIQNSLGTLSYFGAGAPGLSGYWANNFFINAQNDLVFNTNGQTATAIPTMIMKANNNVGIGVTNPTNRLEVAGVISSTTGISSAGGISGATISGSTISTLSTFINSNSATGLPTIGTVGGTGDRIIVDLGTGSEYPHSIGVSADNSMWYSIPSGTRHQFYAGGSNILTLFGSTVLPIMTWRGNFDITSTVSTGNQVNISTTVANGVVNFLLANNEGFGCAIGVGGTSLTGNHRNNAFISANRDIIFNTFGRGSTSIPDMIITSNTTVGIGTTNPTATLDINNATNPKINLTRGTLTSFISGTSIGLDIGNSSDTSSLTFNNGVSWPTVTINKINQIITKNNTVTPSVTGTGGYWLIDITAYRFPTQYTSLFFSCSTNSGGNTGYYSGTVIVNGIGNSIASIIAASSNIFLTWQWTGAIMYIVVNVTGITVTAGAPLFYKCIG